MPKQQTDCYPHYVLLFHFIFVDRWQIYFPQACATYLWQSTCNWSEGLCKAVSFYFSLSFIHSTYYMRLFTSAESPHLKRYTNVNQEIYGQLWFHNFLPRISVASLKSKLLNNLSSLLRIGITDANIWKACIVVVANDVQQYKWLNHSFLEWFTSQHDNISMIICGWLDYSM